MKLSQQIALLAAVAGHFAQAQTPPSYKPSTPNTLGVKYNEASQVFVPGYPLGTKDTQMAPVLTLPSPASHDTLYMAFMIDPDKLNATSPTFTETLQWYQPDLRLSKTSNTLSKIAHASNAAAVYGGPAPPEGQIHRYVFLVFEQPKDYKLPEEFESYMEPVVSARYFWDMTRFVEVSGVGRPVAANWFSVSGGKDARDMVVEERKWGWKEWL